MRQDADKDIELVFPRVAGRQGKHEQAEPTNTEESET